MGQDREERRQAAGDGEEPDLPRQGRGHHQQQEPAAAGAGRANRLAQAARRRRRPGDRGRQPIGDAHPADRQERLGPAGGRRHRPRGGLPAGQGHQQLPRHPERPAARQRDPQGGHRGRHPGQAERTRGGLQGIPGRGGRHPGQHAAPGGGQAVRRRHLPRFGKAAGADLQAAGRLPIRLRHPGHQHRPANRAVPARPGHPRPDGQTVPG